MSRTTCDDPSLCWHDFPSHHGRHRSRFAISTKCVSTLNEVCYNKDNVMVKSSFHLYFRSSHYLYSIFLSRVKMNSINWPAPNIWVFIAQLVEHCSANAEAMGSNPVKAQKFFSGLNLQLLKLRL